MMAADGDTRDETLNARALRDSIAADIAITTLVRAAQVRLVEVEQRLRRDILADVARQTGQSIAAPTSFAPPTWKSHG